MAIVDMHCDTVSELWNKYIRGDEVNLRENTFQLDLIRMKNAGYIVQNFALFVDKRIYNNPWRQFQNLYDFYSKELEKNRDIIQPVFTYQDILNHRKKGLMSALLTVEEGAVCGGKLELLLDMYEKGVRMMTITWNLENELGYPHTCHEMGLKEKGKEFLSKMEEIGMIIDVSHLSDRGFYEVLEETKNPFVASHSNARTICNHSRNLTDEMIQHISNRGGVIGLNFYPDFLKLNKRETDVQVFEELFFHINHFLNIGGEDCLGLGSDFDGMESQGALKGVQDFNEWKEDLKKRGITSSVIDKIFYKNVLDLYKEIL